MPQTKIQGKFYPLTGEVTAKLRQAKLTAAEWRIWSYLVEIDPWGDRYQDIDSLDVMSKCNCSRATFYRAIAKFQKLKIFDIQDKGFSIRNLTGAKSLKSSQEEGSSLKLKQNDLRTEKVVSKMRLDSQNCESDLKNEHAVSKMRLDSQNCENRPLKELPDKAFNSSQSIQTYTDFKRSLSEREREKFFNFVQEKIKNLEKPINDLEAWLACKNAAHKNRWEVYYSNYQEEGKNQNPDLTTQANNPRKSHPSKIEQTIKNFRQKMKINLPEEELESKEIISEELQRRNEELNRLLNNLPEYGQSSAPDPQEEVPGVEQQYEALRQMGREAAEERAKNHGLNVEQRRAEIQRQIEEFNRFNDIKNNSQDGEENLKNG